MDIAKKLKLARKNAGLRQKQVAERTGIDDSSLSSFENDNSEPRLAQLDKLAQVYHLPLSYFFQDSEPKPQFVMWRNKPKNDKEIQAEFLQLCRQYKQLEIWTNEVNDKHLPSFDKQCGSFGYTEAKELASEVRHIMGLGDRPGESLYWTLEEVYDVKVFHMDLGNKGTAACAVSDEFGEAILLNKRCARWRRNHDLAHELFHLLTWNYFEHGKGVCKPTVKEEKFATCFAGNLLLPTDVARTAIDKAADSKGRIPFSKLDNIAREFDVSLESLIWRIHFLFGLREDKTQNLRNKARKYVKTVPRSNSPEPQLFSERYRALAIKALQNSDISLGSFAKFMKITRKEAGQYFERMESNYAEVPTFAT